MEKIDPKLTAAKVYPIDQIREAYDEEAYTDPEPQMEPMSTYERVIGVLMAGIAFAIIATCVFK